MKFELEGPVACRQRQLHHHHHHHHHPLHHHNLDLDLRQAAAAAREADYQEHQIQEQQQRYLTIEDVKSTRNSCWLCGCNWLENHVSLDCPECDGYALSRPCPSCDGKCEQRWTRNISATHDRHKAFWTGQCKFQTTAS